MELEAVQIASLVLGVRSAGSSDAVEYYNGHDARKLARAVASGSFDDTTFAADAAAEEDVRAMPRPSPAPMPAHTAHIYLGMASVIYWQQLRTPSPRSLRRFTAVC